MSSSGSRAILGCTKIAVGIGQIVDLVPDGTRSQMVIVLGIIAAEVEQRNRNIPGVPCNHCERKEHRYVDSRQCRQHYNHTNSHSESVRSGKSPSRVRFSDSAIKN